MRLKKLVSRPPKSLLREKIGFKIWIERYCELGHPGTLVCGLHLYPSQEEHFHFGVFSEKLKLTKSSVQSLITFNCDIKFPKGFLSL